MFEGFEPTPRLIRFYLDWRTGKIPEKLFLSKLREAV
jgi:hypothetical protein